ncbi:MAG: hypothetical protein ACOX8P_03815 [Tepidanaerobacteraceae bacterium]|jgi:hypothetical protein
MRKLVDVITSYTIVLPSYVIDKLKTVIKLKFPTKYLALARFLLELPFEYTNTIERIDVDRYPKTRDKKDLPV